MAEILWCETCGEEPAEVRSTHAALCGECFGASIREVVEETTGDRICGHPIYHDGKVCALCVEPFGTEHEHGGYRK